jgi:hypothetical protein
VLRAEGEVVFVAAGKAVEAPDALAVRDIVRVL